MTKIRTLPDLNEALDHESSWRKRELINLKLMHEHARDHQAVMLRRAGVALLYAHWEGFVKNAGASYVEYVWRRRLRYRQLKPGFVALGMKSRSQQAAESRRGQILREVAAFFLDHLEDTADLSPTTAIQTRSNLSSQRLRDIIAILELDYTPYKLREKTVIDQLLKHRNQIAHGQFLEVDANEFGKLHQEVMSMLDEFRAQIESAAQTKGYER